jgi:hypothetical protein
MPERTHTSVTAVQGRPMCSSVPRITSPADRGPGLAGSAAGRRERHVAVFSRNDDGRAVTPDEDFARLLEKGPNVVDIHLAEEDEVLSRPA